MIVTAQTAKKEDKQLLDDVNGSQQKVPVSAPTEISRPPAMVNPCNLPAQETSDGDKKTTQLDICKLLQH